MQRRANAQTRFWGFIIIAMLLCFSASCAVSQIHYSRNAAHLKNLGLEKLALDQRVTELTNRLSYVRSDAYVERVARDELSLIMPGEIRYVSNR